MRAAHEAAVAQMPPTTRTARRRTEEQPRMQAEEGKRDWEVMKENLPQRSEVNTQWWLPATTELSFPF